MTASIPLCALCVITTNSSPTFWAQLSVLCTSKQLELWLSADWLLAWNVTLFLLARWRPVTRIPCVCSPKGTHGWAKNNKNTSKQFKCELSATSRAAKCYDNLCITAKNEFQTWPHAWIPWTLPQHHFIQLDWRPWSPMLTTPAHWNIPRHYPQNDKCELMW